MLYAEDMKLSEYLCAERGRAATLARNLGVSPSYVAQLSEGRRPVPADRARRIETETGGAVTRKDLRPDDWHEIWPELAADRFAHTTEQPDAHTPNLLLGDLRGLAPGPNVGRRADDPPGLEQAHLQAEREPAEACYCFGPLPRAAERREQGQPVAVDRRGGERRADELGERGGR